MKCAGEKPLDRALLPWKHRASHWLSPEFRTRNWLIWGFKSIYDDNGIENVKKGFMRKTTTLHVHHTVWYISLPKMHHNERYSRWRHLFILMCQLEAHRFLKQKIPLFYSLQIWIPKPRFLNSDVSCCLMWRFVEEVYKILSFVLSNLANKWKFNTKWDQIHKRRRYPLSPNISNRASLCDYTWRLTLDLTGLNCFIVLLSFFHTHKI